MKKPISITLEEDLLNRLKEISRKTGISISTLVNIVLEGIKCLDDFAS